MKEDLRLHRSGSIAAGADGVLRIAFDSARAPIGGACGTGACGGCPATAQSASMTLRHLCSLPGVGDPMAGDRVELSIDAAGLVRTAAAAFGIPLAGLLAGAIAGAGLGSRMPGEWASIAFGGAGLALGLGWLKFKGADLVGLLDLRARTLPSGSAEASAAGPVRRVKSRSEV